jgi:hypothetical protein
MECSFKYLPSNAAPILQYDRGPSFDFLAKILGADTPLFVTQYPDNSVITVLFIH